MAKEPITPKDAASATAIGSAMRIGVARHKGKVAAGMAAGAGGKAGRRPDSTRAKVATAVAVVAVMVAMIALLLVFKR